MDANERQSDTADGPILRSESYEGQADMNWLRKMTVGRRCDQKTLPQYFLAQPDGQHGLRPCAAVAAQFSSSLSASISVNKWFQKDRPFPFFFSLCVLCAFVVKVWVLKPELTTKSKLPITARSTTA
jgi:hypothetical protein